MERAGEKYYVQVLCLERVLGPLTQMAEETAQACDICFLIIHHHFGIAFYFIFPTGKKDNNASPLKKNEITSLSA